MEAQKYVTKDMSQSLQNTQVYYYCTSTVPVPACTGAAPTLVMVGSAKSLRRLRVLSAIEWLQAVPQKEGLALH